MTLARKPFLEPRAIAVMAENMTVPQISARLNISEDDVADKLDAAGRAGQGSWLLRCNKTGRFWYLHTCRACYRTAQAVGLVDYDFNLVAQPPVPKMLPGDMNARIAELRGRKWSIARISKEVGISPPAVHKRLKKMVER